MSEHAESVVQVYLVGGAVRDRLLGRTVTERDWVVVGATPEIMQAKGYTPVGNDFPVFLHPDTKEEYALARTERKTARGYHGFQFYCAPDVRLEDDLIRRDLTINAMAETADGEIIDPYGGKADLDNRLLRHVSAAFAEDPVRILRIARFAARFHHLGFRVADETNQLMREMVAAGEVDALVPERVWAECARALMEAHPEVFFQVLRDCGALTVIFPEVDALFGVPQPPAHHPEIDSGVHTLMALQQSARINAELPTRFAVLCHDLGKALTPASEWPRHIAHEARGEKPILALCQRLNVPNNCKELALLTAKFHLHTHRAFELKAETLAKLFEHSDLLRRPERFEQFLQACECDARGRLGLADRDYPNADFLRRAARAYRSVNASLIDKTAHQGAAFGLELKRLRLAALAPIAQPHKHALGAAHD